MPAATRLRPDQPRCRRFAWGAGPRRSARSGCVASAAHGGMGRWWRGAVLLVLAAPIALVARHLGVAFVQLFDAQIVRSGGDLPPGSIPGADGWLGAVAVVVCFGAMRGAHARVARALRTGDAFPGPAVCSLWASVCFADGIAAGFAAVMAGAFAFAVLFDCATSAGEPFTRPADGAHELGQR